MTATLKQILLEMQSGILAGQELEEKELLVLQELCGSDDQPDIAAIYQTLGASGTILAIPVLCAHLKTANNKDKLLVKVAIKMIRARAKARGSLFPDVFYTVEHWRPRWLGSKNTFLSYVEFIADAYIQCGHAESEQNRIGEILAEEMNIDTYPYHSFADFKTCQISWDYREDYRVIEERIDEERLLDNLEKVGVSGSDLSLITGTLMDLQYDYLIARLKLKGDLEYYRFVFSIAESLNKDVNASNED